jgi:hypothetical protein
MAEGEVRSMGRRGREEARSGESPGGPVKTAGSHSLGLVRGTQREQGYSFWSIQPRAGMATL